MAKITAPLFSKIARGAIARTLIFQNNGTTQTVKRWRAPRKTLSPQQLLRREAYRAATRAWNNLTAPQKQAWAIAAHGDMLTGWNAYLSNYLRTPQNAGTTTWDNATTTWDDHLTRWDAPL